jgi:hypothetical protein
MMGLRDESSAAAHILESIRLLSLIKLVVECFRPCAAALYPVCTTQRASGRISIVARCCVIGLQHVINSWLRAPRRCERL